MAEGIPSTSRSFETRAEAEEWLKSHVSIAGEYYFAVHHKRLKRHTIHPVASSLAEWEEKKRAANREEARDPAAEAEGEGG